MPHAKGNGKALVLLLGVIVVVVVMGSFFYLWQPAEPKKEGQNDSVLALSTKDAAYLQQVEHLGGFVFGDLTLPPLAKALRAADRQTLAKIFAPGFKAHLFKGSARIKTRAYASLRAWDKGMEKTGESTQDDFLNLLLATRKRFTKLDICALKVMQMEPDKHQQLDGSWNGSMKIILAGKTKNGVARRVMRFTIRLAKLNDDFPDQHQWLTAADCYEMREAAAKQMLLQDITKETGIRVDELRDNWKLPAKANRPALTGGIYLSDYNRDGFMDLLITDINGHFLYRGLPNARFIKANSEMGLPEKPLIKSLGAVFADWNGDGYEDLLLGNKLYKNDGGRRFVELQTAQHSLYLDPGASQFAVADYDLDGRLDLYVIGLKKRTSVRNWVGKNDQAQNQLWRNLGDFQFIEVTRKTKTAGNGSSAFAAIWFDANSDGRPDIMTACEFGTNDFLLNQPDGVFKPGPVPEGYGGFSMGITYSDIDNDGRSDPYIANMYSKAGERIVGNLALGLYKPEIDKQLRDFVSGNELYHNVGGKFKRIGRSSGVSDVGWAYGVGFVDLDGDGFPEPYAPVGYQSVSPNKPDG